MNGNNNTISSGGANNFIAGAKTSTLAGGSQQVIIGGHNHSITGSNEGGIYGGYQNTIQGGDDSTIYGGRGNLLQGGNKPSIINGGNNTITNSSATLKTIVGGSYGTISATGINTYDETDGLAIFNSRRSSITGTTFFGGILSSHQSNIGGAATTDRFNGIFNSSGSTIINSTGSTIVGSYGTAVSGKTFAVGLGLNNKTLDYNFTTHLDNSYTYRTKSFGVINAGSVSGPINVDLSLGTLYYFTITGDTEPNFTNFREGQQVQFWIENTSNYSVSAATITGGGSVYAKGGVINPTNNEISGYYGTIVNGNMFLDEHLNFQAV